MEDINIKFYQEFDKLCNIQNNVYSNFLSTIALDAIYKNIVGDDLFDYDEFKRNNFDKYNYILYVEYAKKNYITNMVKNNLEGMMNNSVLYSPCKLLSLYLEENIKNEKIFNQRCIKLTDDLKDKLIIDFLSKENLEYKDLYLKLKDDRKILFLDEAFDNYEGFTYVNPNYDCNNDDFYIFVNYFYDDFYALTVLVHELGHLKEYLELKQILTQDQYIKYQLTSPYNEVNAMSLSLKFIKYLERLGLEKDEIKFLRNQELILYSNNINDLVLKNTPDVDYASLLSSLRYTYGGIISMFFDSINDKDILNKKEDRFVREKILNNDVKILDKIGCNTKCENYAVKKYIKKCL